MHANAERPTFTSPWLNTDEAASYLGNSPKSLAIWRCQGQGPRYHILNKRLVRYHVDDLDAFVIGDGGGSDAHCNS